MNAGISWKHIDLGRDSWDVLYGVIGRWRGLIVHTPKPGASALRLGLAMSSGQQINTPLFGLQKSPLQNCSEIHYTAIMFLLAMNKTLFRV